MKIVNSKLWLTIATLALVMVPIVVFAVMSVKPVEPGKYDNFAQCLTDSGAKMYGAYWCSHCKIQKEMFGTSFDKVNSIECSLAGGQGQTTECTEAGIEGYPTWEFKDGSRLSGEVSLETLSEKSGCSLSDN